MDEKNEPEPVGTKIIPRLLQDEMKQSYLDYSMSVIVGRALPDVRDGLKPVHRRVLFTMWESGLLHNKPFKKSANVVGNCMAKYHPHGDLAIYDTLVRLAQEFSLRYPLVKGQGNFGSVDGDKAAAMRYTEAKLSRIAEELLQDIDKETVKFVPNFDESVKEPSVLPAKLPNLLINGSSGIAVGMATNIPPHNLSEVVDGVVQFIDNPNVTIHELMQHVKGPDFPTGGLICGRNGITNAYSTGRGKVVVRAKVDTEDKQKKRIIVSEIPYMVNKAELIAEIARLVNEKKIIGITDLRDESDREGMRVVIELRKDADPDIVLNQLYSQTRMQSTFGVVMLCLVNNVPKVLNLKQTISYYVDHRKDVVTKRTQFELHKAKERAHILEGLLIALSHIDAVVKRIKESQSTEKAKESLKSAYTLSDKQAQAILEMRLQRLTSLEQDKIRNEHKDLLVLIEKLESILANPQKVLNIIKEELKKLKEQYGDDRRSSILDMEVTALNMEDLIEEDEVVVTVTKSGYIKRIPLDTYRQQNRGGKGIIATTTKEEDIVSNIFVANTHATILFFTSKGKVHWIKTYNIPEASRQARGKAIVNLIHLDAGEQVSAFIPVKEFDEQHYLLMATKKGTAKKTSLKAYSKPRKGGIIAITLDGEDKLVDVRKTDGNQEVILATKNGSAVRFNEKAVRAAGRAAQGVRGILLRGDDEVVGMVLASDDKTLLTVTENGFGKRTPVNDYRLTNRGGSGVINIQCTGRNGKVASINSVQDGDDVMVVSKNGITIRIPVSNLSIIGRNTQGFRVMRLSQQDRVVSTTKIDAQPTSENTD